MGLPIWRPSSAAQSTSISEKSKQDLARSAIRRRPVPRHNGRALRSPPPNRQDTDIPPIPSDAAMDARSREIESHIRRYHPNYQSDPSRIAHVSTAEPPQSAPPRSPSPMTVTQGSIFVAHNPENVTAASQTVDASRPESRRGPHRRGSRPRSQPISPPNDMPPLRRMGNRSITDFTTQDPSRVLAGVDGLGDRDRSWSPEAHQWETMLTTITPDPSLPSAESSFAAEAASNPAPRSPRSFRRQDRQDTPADFRTATSRNRGEDSDSSTPPSPQSNTHQPDHSPSDFSTMDPQHLNPRLLDNASADNLLYRLRELRNTLENATTRFNYCTFRSEPTDSSEFMRRIFDRMRSAIDSFGHHSESLAMLMTTFDPEVPYLTTPHDSEVSHSGSFISSTRASEPQAHDSTTSEHGNRQRRASTSRPITHQVQHQGSRDSPHTVSHTHALPRNIPSTASGRSAEDARRAMQNATSRRAATTRTHLGMARSTDSNITHVNNLRRAHRDAERATLVQRQLQRASDRAPASAASEQLLSHIAQVRRHRSNIEAATAERRRLEFAEHETRIRENAAAMRARQLEVLEARDREIMRTEVPDSGRPEESQGEERGS